MFASSIEHVAFAMYSSSIVNRDMRVASCFSQATRHFPRKNDPPLVLILLSILPTQYASTYVIRVNSSLFVYYKPKSSVPFRYLKILFTSCTCVSFGVYWNLETNPTTFIIFGLDVATYSRLPTIDFYRVWLDFRGLPSLLSLQLVIMGILTGLQSFILNFLSVSFMYLLKEMNMPLPDWEIYRLIKNDSSPSMDVSNSFFISSSNFWLKLLILLQKWCHLHKPK